MVIGFKVAYLHSVCWQCDCSGHERVLRVGRAALERRAEPARGGGRGVAGAAVHSPQLLRHAPLPRLVLWRRWERRRWWT